ncbi:type II toxin-antitoxin system VapC family toxin [Sporolituus thermophilus]|uniref:Predicted nucleic acid-binding protein, contains PIN domain n=1 Tax=Sporolituus thermophilus DSM 23256 TaxID=1123285 RepID=A0A1G7NZP0_9FIRM|nr:PIN domain-containing protein [Sporolituus thermophilus]SDF79327.1 Predicted nucleic acid-binding protein, contains PIN domain [Sporolituus thermophilus DSM 23256]
MRLWTYISTRFSHVALDTACFIYVFEDHPSYAGPVQELLQAINAGKIACTSSVLVFLECLVQPYKLENYSAAITCQRFLHLLNINYKAVDERIAVQAACLRATYNVKPMDAIHLATAIASGAKAFVTNDKELKRVANEIAVVILDDYCDEGHQ